MKIFGIYTGVIKLEEGVCCDQCVLLAKFCWPLSCFILHAKAIPAQKAGDPSLPDACCSLTAWPSPTHTIP